MDRPGNIHVCKIQLIMLYLIWGISKKSLVWRGVTILLFRGIPILPRRERWKRNQHFNWKVISNMKILGIPLQVFMLQWTTNNPHPCDPAQAAALHPSSVHGTNWDAEEVFTLLITIACSDVWAASRWWRECEDTAEWASLCSYHSGLMRAISFSEQWRLRAQAMNPKWLRSSSKPHGDFLSRCPSVYRCWLKTRSLQLNRSGRQKKCLCVCTEEECQCSRWLDLYRKDLPDSEDQGTEHKPFPHTSPTGFLPDKLYHCIKANTNT